MGTRQNYAVRDPKTGLYEIGVPGSRVFCHQKWLEQIFQWRGEKALLRKWRAHEAMSEEEEILGRELEDRARRGENIGVPSREVAAHFRIVGKSRSKGGGLVARPIKGYEFSHPKDILRVYDFGPSRNPHTGEWERGGNEAVPEGYEVLCRTPGGSVIVKKPTKKGKIEKK